MPESDDLPAQRMLALTNQMLRAAEMEDWESVSGFSIERQALAGPGFQATDVELRALLDSNNELKELAMGQRTRLSALLARLKSGRKAANAYQQARELSNAWEANHKEV